jgi:nucleoid DNA-binding protein
MKKISKIKKVFSSKKKIEKSMPKKITQVNKAFTKSQIASYLSASACLTKKQAVEVIDALGGLIELHLNKRGPGEFTWPSLIKFRIIKKAATKARQGVNPFTGETMMFAAKPARNIVKIRALKKLKEVVA